MEQKLENNMSIKLYSTSFELNKNELNSITKDISNFFNIKKIENIELIIVESREEYNKLAEQRQTPRWEVGCCKNGKIILFSPDAMEKESTHKKEEFYQILTHETTHCFLKMNSIQCKNIPPWFDEGLAGFIAKQYKTEEGKFKLPKGILNLLEITTYNKWNMLGQPYVLSYLFIYYINKEYPKQLEQLIKQLKQSNDFQEALKISFRESINKIYREYIKWLNENILKWDFLY